jgi:hypothetical protein
VGTCFRGRATRTHRTIMSRTVPHTRGQHQHPIILHTTTNIALTITFTLQSCSIIIQSFQTKLKTITITRQVLDTTHDIHRQQTKIRNSTLTTPPLPSSFPNTAPVKQ